MARWREASDTARYIAQFCSLCVVSLLARGCFVRLGVRLAFPTAAGVAAEVVLLCEVKRCCLHTFKTSAGMRGKHLHFLSFSAPISMKELGQVLRWLGVFTFTHPA